MDFCSIIILSYNAKLEQFILTLESIIHQKNVSYEIIIADDQSKVFYEKEINEFLRLKNITQYSILRHQKNVGTVRNLYDALLECHGEIVKVIGAGDALYDEHTLYKLCDGLYKSKSAIAVALVKEFYRDGNRYYKNTRIIPNNLNAFIRRDEREINKTIIKYEQWIAGVALIYKRELIIPHLQRILGKVTYCEDMISSFVVLQGQGIEYIPINSMWYERGEGISSKSGASVPKGMIQDQIELYKLTKYAEKNSWRNLGKEIIHRQKSKKFRTLLKIIFEPGMIALELKTKKQVRNGLYDIPGEGFLDDTEFLNKYQKICQYLKGADKCK